MKKAFIKYSFFIEERCKKTLLRGGESSHHSLADTGGGSGDNGNT
jgi:hypothetical protein